MTMTVPHRLPPAARQRGLTLLELMVALVIALVVTLAAISALLFAREGFSTLDASSQLRENGRFLTELMSRVVVQAGYRATVSAAVQRNTRWVALTNQADIEGYNNQLSTAGATEEPTAASALKARSASTCTVASDSSCVSGGSDILVVRFQGQNTPDLVDPPQADGSMINCNGEAQAHARNQDLVSDATNVFYVKSSTSGEPVLMCATLTGGAWRSTPLISGVESFQVLYGVDGVTPNIAVAATSATSVPLSQPPTRWLRADQMVVPSDAAGTARNWRRVTDVRIGLVLRSLPATSQSQSTRVYPFADGASSPFVSSQDPGSEMTVSADRRFRQAVSFTVHLRNTLN